jgi:probable rRNA maturation factor
MEPLVDTLTEDARWETAGLSALADRAAAAVCDDLGLAPSGFQISLLGCDDARIAALNADFRGKAQPTNVLSWPAEDLAADTPGAEPARPLPGDPADPWVLGDIAIAWETCKAEAAAAGKPLADHATHLLVHGILHLVGYDHQTEPDAALMEGIETRILARLGLPDPYS